MDFYISLLFCCLCERISKVHHIVHKDVRQSQLTVALTTMLQMPMDVIWNMSMTRSFFGTGTNDNKTRRKENTHNNNNNDDRTIWAIGIFRIHVVYYGSQNINRHVHIEYHMLVTFMTLEQVFHRTTKYSTYFITYKSYRLSHVIVILVAMAAAMVVWNARKIGIASIVIGNKFDGGFSWMWYAFDNAHTYKYTQVEQSELATKEMQRSWTICPYKIECVQFNLFIAWPTHLIRGVFLEQRCGAQWMNGRTDTHAHILYRIILQSDKIINSFCVCRKKSDLANVLMFNQHELYIDAVLTKIKAPRIKISNRFYCCCSALFSLLLSPLS